MMYVVFRFPKLAVFSIAALILAFAQGAEAAQCRNANDLKNDSYTNACVPNGTCKGVSGVCTNISKMGLPNGTQKVTGIYCQVTCKNTTTNYAFDNSYKDPMTECPIRRPGITGEYGSDDSCPNWVAPPNWTPTKKSYNDAAAVAAGTAGQTAADAYCDGLKDTVCGQKANCMQMPAMAQAVCCKPDSMTTPTPPPTTPPPTSTPSPSPSPTMPH